MTHRRIQIECVALAVCIVGTLFLPNITTPVKASRGLTVTVQTEEGQILPLYSDSFALVIGASQYTQGWPDLPGVINDVQHIQSALSDHGHVFCSFLALVLRKELDQRLAQSKHRFEWSDIKQDLKALKQVEIEENGTRFAIRSECKGVCGKIFQSVRVALPPTIMELA